MCRLAGVSAPAAELDADGEIRDHFGSKIEGAGEQGERCHPLREGVRIVESPVAPTQNQHSSPGTRDRLVQEVIAVRSIPANLLVHNALPSDSSEVFAQAAGFFRKTRAERESGA